MKTKLKFCLTVAAIWVCNAACFAQSAIKYVPLQTPCRAIDTRLSSSNPNGVSPLVGGTEYVVPIGTSSYNPCSLPNTAVAFSLNVTAVPTGSTNGFLTVLIPTFVGTPATSTIDYKADPIANFAIVPTVTTGVDAGSVFVYSSLNTNLVLDVAGYWLPQ